MHKHKVVLFRTESAEMEIEAASAEEAKAIAVERVNSAACIADLDLEWNVDGAICVDTYAE